MARTPSPTGLATGAAPREDGDGHPSGDPRFAMLDKSMRRARYAQDQLIELLHVAQDIFGYLGDDVLLYLAQQLQLPTSHVYGVATFYSLFGFDPPGEHTCTVCTGTACFVKGADDIVRSLTDAFALIPGETSADGRLTVSNARCLGSCGLAPVVVVDGEVRGQQEAAGVVAAVRAALAADAGTGTGEAADTDGAARTDGVAPGEDAT
jgi:bidirectional [NiFe] hydrogenase diaphorase subunit